MRRAWEHAVLASAASVIVVPPPSPLRGRADLRVRAIRVGVVISTAWMLTDVYAVITGGITRRQYSRVLLVPAWILELQQLVTTPANQAAVAIVTPTNTTTSSAIPQQIDVDLDVDVEDVTVPDPTAFAAGSGPSTGLGFEGISIAIVGAGATPIKQCSVQWESACRRRPFAPFA